MEYGEHVAAVAAELDGLVTAVRAGSIGAPVPTCPGWTVADLALHVGQFCAFWTHVLCEGSGRPKPAYLGEPAGDAFGPWLAGVGRDLVTELRETPPTTAVWTWYEADKSARFVARRSAHELAVHRFDAQSARGASRPIGAALSADGIDEMITTLVEARARSGQAGGETMLLQATDADRQWLVTLLADGIHVGPPNGAAALTLRGTAGDLELLLYGRPTPGPVERRGDEEVLDGWYREFIF